MFILHIFGILLDTQLFKEKHWQTSELIIWALHTVHHARIIKGESHS